MIRVLYLASILISLAALVALDRRLKVGVVASRRLLRTTAATVSLFLTFDLVGATRGWFFSDPHLNVLIVPPGIPLEEPILLGFLSLLSLSLWQGSRRFLS